MKSRRSIFSPLWDLFTRMEPEDFVPEAGPDPGVACAPAASQRGPSGNHHPNGHTVPAVDEGTFHWAMRALPLKEACQHLLICGTTGSGKTIAIRLFLQSIAHRFGRDRKTAEQLIIFDAKGDAIPLLAGMGLRPEHPNVWILNPLDRRSRGWNISEAVSSPVMARNFATLLVPEERQSTAPFFTDAARELIYAVILGLNQAAGQTWGLRDLLCALESEEHIEAVAAHQPRAHALARRILGDDLHSGSVLSTLGSKLGRFELVASLWDANRSSARFSIPKFLAEPGVLILGNDPLLRDSLWPINATLLKAISHHVLRGPETRQPRHWFVLDEFRAMEKVDCVHDLLNRGRSKGASVLLGVQSVEGLMDVYNEHSANDLLSQCTYKTFLRQGDPRTADWAKNYFGELRRVEPQRYDASGYDADQRGLNHQLRERSMFIASYFLDLPLPRPGGVYSCVSDVPSLGTTIITERPFDEVLARCIPPSDDPALELIEGGEHQSLRPWEPEEKKKFCRELTPATNPAAPGAPAPPAPPLPRLTSTKWKLKPGDLVDAELLAQRLRQRSDALSAWLCDQFTAKNRASLLTGAGEPRTDVERIIRTQLNTLILGPSIWDPTRFAHVELRPLTRQLTQVAPDQVDVARLNRMLLEDGYPLIIARQPQPTQPEA